MKFLVRNNNMQLQVLTLKSGESLSLVPRGTAPISSEEIGPDVEIKANAGSITLIKVAEPAATE